MSCEECGVCKSISDSGVESTEQHLNRVESRRSPILLIVGEAPYPTNPVDDYAFCKPSWCEQVEYNCSGRYVLCSLGVKLEHVYHKYSTPKELFQELKMYGVLFQNRFVGLNKDNSPSKSQTNRNLDNLLQTCSVIVLCGRETHDLVKKISNKAQVFDVIHPAARCKGYCPRWVQVWSEPGKLLQMLEQSGGGPIHNAINAVNA